MYSRFSKRNFKFFSLGSHHLTMLGELVFRAWPYFKPGGYSSAVEALTDIINSDLALVCAVWDGYGTPKIAGVVWISDLQPVSYFHILLDKPYIRHAGTLLKSAVHRTFREKPELKALKIYGKRSYGIYRFLERQKLGCLSWIKNGNYDAASGKLEDEWEFVMTPFEIGYDENKPVEDPHCGKIEKTERAENSENGASGQRKYRVWFRKLQQRVLQLFHGHR